MSYNTQIQAELINILFKCINPDLIIIDLGKIDKKLKDHSLSS